MYRIDELITEIHKGEIIEIPGDLTEEQKKRIEMRFQSKIFATENLQHNFRKESKSTYKRRKGIHRWKTAVILAATLILTLGLTVYAAKQNEWSVALTNFMGINESDTLQLEGGEVVINKKTTSTWTDYAKKPLGEEKQISITQMTSIGDKNSAYLRINTNYELPIDFNEKTDYILPENHRIDIVYKNKLGREEIRTFASTFTSIYEEGKLGFLISIESYENLNTCNVSLRIEDLYWYHDLGQHEETKEGEPEELLATGKWETEWKYSYKSNVQTIRTLKRIETREGEIFLTKIEISPISIRVEAVRNPKDRDLPWTTELLEEIQYEDGEVISVKNASVDGLGNGIFIEEFVKVYDFGKVLRPEKVKCVKVCGENVNK